MQLSRAATESDLQELASIAGCPYLSVDLHVIQSYPHTPIWVEYLISYGSAKIVFGQSYKSRHLSQDRNQKR